MIHPRPLEPLGWSALDFLAAHNSLIHSLPCAVTLGSAAYRAAFFMCAECELPHK